RGVIDRRRGDAQVFQPGEAGYSGLFQTDPRVIEDNRTDLCACRQVSGVDPAVGAGDEHGSPGVGKAGDGVGQQRLGHCCYATRSPLRILAARLSTPGNILAGSRVTTTSRIVGRPFSARAAFSAPRSSPGASTRIPLQPSASATLA